MFNLRRTSPCFTFALLFVAALLFSSSLSVSAQTADGKGNQPLVQRFQDVPDNYIFASFINSLYDNGVVGGFNCGGPGQPCVAPANLPYFAPDQNVTRGQLAKFIDNGRRYVKGAYTGNDDRPGIFTAINDNISTTNNAAIYASGSRAVWGNAITTGSAVGYAGYFYNNGGGTGSQYGVSASSEGVGVRGISRGPNNLQTSVGVYGQSPSNLGYGGQFVNTSTTGGTGLLTSGKTAIQATASGTGTGDGYAGHFVNEGGSSGNQYGLDVEVSGDGAVSSYAGYFRNTGGGSSTHYGILSITSGGSPNSSYGGFFRNDNAGLSNHYGVYAKGATYAGFFDEAANSSISVYAEEAVSASSFVDRAAADSIVVLYKGTEPLQAGDVVALDGNNKLVDGTQYLGVSKSTADTLGMAVGVAQQRMTRITNQLAAEAGQPSTLKVSWGMDQQATAFAQGDLIRIVTHGQVQLQVGSAKFGDRLTIGDGDSFSTAAAGSNYIGKVAGQADKNGYATVYVNFK